MHGPGMFDKIFEFESALATYTGAPYAIMTDCCTHAIELCMRYDQVRSCEFTPYTYLSVPMLMHKLGIQYRYLDEPVQTWSGEYQFVGTRIWDSARRLEPGMYRDGQMQCVSFGHTKTLEIGRGGAILLDDVEAYDAMIQQRYDGRDLAVKPWQSQRVFRVGYHYRPTIEEATRGLELLPQLGSGACQTVAYPDCRQFTIIG
jgi:dTDP-4-amino-4,6-dideoxygalactose transaminase